MADHLRMLFVLFTKNIKMTTVYHIFFTIISFLCLLSFRSTYPPNISITVKTDSILSSVRQKIYLYYLDGNDFFLEDSAEISPQNTKVTLYGYIPYQKTVRLFFSQKGPNDVILIPSPGEKINITITEKDGGARVYKKVTGSSATNDYVDFWNDWEKLLASIVRLNSLEYVYSNSVEYQRAIRDSINIIQEKKRELVIHTLKHSVHPELVWGELISLSNIGFREDSIKKLRQEAHTRFPDYPPIGTLVIDTVFPRANIKSKRNIQIISSLKRKKKLLKSKEQHNLFQKPENQWTVCPISSRTALANFCLSNNREESVLLSQFIGKYTLIVFWASWCLPCVKELYLAKHIYERYTDKINVCLISLGTNKVNWKNGIKRHKLEDLYNLSAVNEQNQLDRDIERLGIKSIPANYLLDPYGNIVAYDIFGIKLTNLLDSLFLQ